MKPRDGEEDESVVAGSSGCFCCSISADTSFSPSSSFSSFISTFFFSEIRSLMCFAFSSAH